MKYSPFIPFRLSPLQKFNTDEEFGLRGWLCEQYRIETGEGEWVLHGFIAEPQKNPKYFEPQGTWAFRIGTLDSFSGLHDKVLSHFGLTRETLSVLEESACMRHPYFFTFHFLPRKDWGGDLAKNEKLYAAYLEQRDELHQGKTSHVRPIFGGNKEQKVTIDNLPPDVIKLCREYMVSHERVLHTSVFDPDSDEYEAIRDTKLSRVENAMLSLDLAKMDSLRYNPESFAKEVVRWYGR